MSTEKKVPGSEYLPKSTLELEIFEQKRKQHIHTAQEFSRRYSLPLELDLDEQELGFFVMKFAENLIKKSLDYTKAQKVLEDEDLSRKKSMPVIGLLYMLHEAIAKKNMRINEPLEKFLAVLAEAHATGEAQRKYDERRDAIFSPIAEIFEHSRKTSDGDQPAPPPQPEKSYPPISEEKKLELQILAHTLSSAFIQLKLTYTPGLAKIVEQKIELYRKKFGITG
jgi:hypothetical protein